MKSRFQALVASGRVMTSIGKGQRKVIHQGRGRENTLLGMGN